MVTEGSNPEKKTLLMLLANIAQSELGNQNCRIGRGVPNYNNFCQQWYGRDHRKENHAVLLGALFCLDFLGIIFEIHRKQMQYLITTL